MFDLFVFTETAKRLEIAHVKDDDICSRLQLEGKEEFPTGDHVLTIVPKVEQKIIIAWLLTA